MPKISFIIPVWNLWDMTKACLESLVHCCAKEELLDQIEVLVIDNNSSDATTTELEPMLKALFSKSGHKITLAENQGFAKASNIGAQKAKGSLLFFLNNDTIMTEGCIGPLLQALDRNPKLGAVGPLLLFPGNKVQHAGICFSPNLELHHAHYLLPAPYVTTQKQRFWQAITGAALLMPKELFKQCDGFHEEYINGFEDLDLCCQIRQKGYKLTVVHKSRIYHHASQTPGRFEHDATNAALLGKRCQGHFKPDQHIVALEASLSSRLSPDLELYTSCTEAKEKALNLIFTQNFDENRCKTNLENEPYWLGGYNLLATYYEKRQCWPEALEVRLQQCRLEPLSQNFGSLGFCAANTGDTDIVADAKQCILDIREKTKDMKKLHHKALHLQQWALQNEDSALADIFSLWLKEHPLS